MGNYYAEYCKYCHNQEERLIATQKNLGLSRDYAADNCTGTIGCEDQAIVFGVILQTKVACRSCGRNGQPASKTCPEQTESLLCMRFEEVVIQIHHHTCYKDQHKR